MIIERRTFIFGLAATLASPALSKIVTAGEDTGPIVTGILKSSLKYRRVQDLIFSSMKSAEEPYSKLHDDPVRYTFMRDRDEVMVVTLNRMATFRWVACPGSELEIRENNIFRVLVEPCNTYTTMNITSNIAPRTLSGTLNSPVSESYRWKDGEPEIVSVTPLYLDDKYLIT